MKNIRFSRFASTVSSFQSNIKYLAVIGVVVVSLLASSGHVSAQPTKVAICPNQDQTAYESLVPLNKGEYTAYVRLNRAGQAEVATVYLEYPEESACQQVGIAGATDSSWSKIGDVSLESNNLQQLTVQLGGQQNSQDASGPSVLLIPKDGAPCSDPNKCAVEYLGQKFFLQPKKISLTADTLRVALYQPYVSTAKVKEVIYSIDDKPAYTTRTLQSFNRRYISPGLHTLTTTVVLADGQALKLQVQFDQNFGVLTYFWPKLYSQKGVGLIIFSAILIMLGLVTLLAIVRLIYKKRQWNKNHILSANVARPILSDDGKQKRLKMMAMIDDTSLFVKAIGIGISVLVLLFVVNQYFIGIFTVDGPSMETTLHDKTKHPLLRMPVTIGKINQHAYLPKRGDIVVFKKDENNLFDEAAEKHDSYVVKRIIGLPGERIIVKEGAITVINKDKPNGFDPDKNVPWASVIAPSEGRLIDITLKDGELFVSGDNRNESIDSRYYGPIQASQVIGRVLN